MASDTIPILKLMEHGGFLGIGEKKSFSPVDAVTEITDDRVYADQSREQVEGAPEYNPSLIEEPAYYRQVYDYYLPADLGRRIHLPRLSAVPGPLGPVRWELLDGREERAGLVSSPPGAATGWPPPLAPWP